jgi:hypothetical protein
MDNPSRWERMSLQEGIEAFPWEHALAIPSRQPFPPHPHNLPREPSDASMIARYAVVGIVASHHYGQVGMLVTHAQVPIVSAPLAHGSQRPRVTALGRYLIHPRLSFAGFAPHVGVSRPAGFHHRPLAELSVRLSPHSAPIRQTCRSCRAASVRRGPRFHGQAFRESEPRGSCELQSA